MAGTVGDIGDLRGVGGAVRAGGFRIEQRAEGVHHIEVRALVEAADIVGLAEAAFLQNEPDGGRVVFDKKPIADLLAVAIDGEGLSIERIEDHQGDELFGKMVGAVVVRAIRREGGEAVGVLEGPDEVVAGGFGGGVGAVRCEGGGLRKGGVVRSESSVNFISRDMEETERGAAVVGEGFPIMARGIQETQRAGDIRLHERLGRVDRAIHMRLGGEIQHGIDLMLGEQSRNQFLVPDITLLKNIARIGGEVREVGGIARVGEQVEIDQFL